MDDIHKYYKDKKELFWAFQNLDFRQVKVNHLF